MTAPSSGSQWTDSNAGRHLLVNTSAALAALLMTAPAFAQGNCLSEECFYSSRVRDFQILDSDTLVVYTGSDRCAYVVDVIGIFCDLTYLPQVEFFRTRDRILESNTGRGRLDGGFARNERICPNNASGYSLETFGFSSIDEDDMPRGRPACEVSSVTPASDNDLIELLTNEGITAPPPPIGNGEITRKQPPPTGE